MVGRNGGELWDRDGVQSLQGLRANNNGGHLRRLVVLVVEVKEGSTSIRDGGRGLGADNGRSVASGELCIVRVRITLGL